VIDARLALPRAAIPDTGRIHTLEALCDRIVPQPVDRPPVPLAAMVVSPATCFGNRRQGDASGLRQCDDLLRAWRRPFPRIGSCWTERQSAGSRLPITNTCGTPDLRGVCS